MNVNKVAMNLKQNQMQKTSKCSSSVTKENIKLSRNLLASLQKAEGLMASYGDKFIAIDTWLNCKF